MQVLSHIAACEAGTAESHRYFFIYIIVKHRFVFFNMILGNLPHTNTIECCPAANQTKST